MSVGIGPSTPRVTVVTPTYNRAGLLPETIASVLGQTFSDFEYLIVDDGSRDATEEVVRGFDDPRLSYFWHPNRGEAASTNRGWGLARGEYFAFLSSDDPVFPDWLEQMVRFMDENPEILVAYPDWQIIDEKSAPLHDIQTQDYSFRKMVAWFYTIPGPGAVIRRGAVKDDHLRNPSYRYAPDLESWFRLGLLGPFARLPRTLARWRQHPGSITVANRSRARAREMVRLVREFFARPDIPADIRPLRRFALSRAHATASFVLKDADPLRSMLHLRRSYRVSRKDPPGLIPWLIREPEPSRAEIAMELLRAMRARIGRSDGPSPVAAAPAAENTPPAEPDDPPAPDAPAPDAAARFDALWPLLRTDLAELRDVISPLTPTADMAARLRGLLAPPAPATVGRTMRAVLDRLPDRIEHLLVVPWMGVKGGSETVVARLVEALAEHYRQGGLCILGPDSGFDATPQVEGAVPVVSFNAVDPSLDLAARQEIFDRIMIQRRPPVVHCVNAYVGWCMFKERGEFYAQDSRLYGNIYSDIRIGDGIPAAEYFYNHFANCIAYMAGMIADNETVVRKAASFFGLPPRHREKLHVVRTPILCAAGGDPRRDLRAFTPSSAKRSLWMSRIASEKRLDVLAAIAARCPDRGFAVYGTKGLGAVDTSQIEAQPNIELRGAFERLGDIPAGDFDSYVFTTSGEGMPIALLEVAALGLPIVAPDVGGIGEFVDETTGWLVSGPEAVDEYVEALRMIHENPREAARRVGAAQRRLLKSHTMAAFRTALGRIPGYLGAPS